jgi:hypothetical protein
MARKFQVLKVCLICGEREAFPPGSYCKICRSEYRKEYYQLNRAKELENDKKWRNSNKNKKAIQVKKWAKKNQDKIREYSRRGAVKIRSSVSGRINDAMSSAVYRSLKGKKGKVHWEDVVGYSVNELKDHIEKQFLNGMTWENYGKYTWHIDHIKPIVSFKITSNEDVAFKECWGLKNLRPLWAFDNHSKGARCG